MKNAVRLSLAALAFMGSACFRTTYSNVSPPARAPIEEPPDISRVAPQSWQHFFIWGWVPRERRIDAAAACGGLEHVERIETQQTFVQGLVAVLASYYINIYSPYTAAVICDHTEER